MVWIRIHVGFLCACDTHVSLKHDADKIIVCEKAGLIFVFNFHPSTSYTGYKIGAPKPGKYKVCLDVLFISLNSPMMLYLEVTKELIILQLSTATTILGITDHVPCLFIYPVEQSLYTSRQINVLFRIFFVYYINKRVL